MRKFTPEYHDPRNDKDYGMDNEPPELELEEDEEDEDNEIEWEEDPHTTGADE